METECLLQADLRQALQAFQRQCKGVRFREAVAGCRVVAH